MKFGQIHDEQLTDDAALELLFQRAVKCGLAVPNEPGRLRFWSTAERALRVGKHPAGVFHRLLTTGKDYASAADEDRANARLKAMRRPDGDRRGDADGPRHVSEHLRRLPFAAAAD